MDGVFDGTGPIGAEVFSDEQGSGQSRFPWVRISADLRRLFFALVCRTNLMRGVFLLSFRLLF